MIIDDSPLERFVAETVIKKSLFAEEVMSFSGPADTLAYLESLVEGAKPFPDVLFVDIHMPLMNGFEFLDKYVEYPDEIKRRCRVVMFSSSEAQEDILRMKKYPVIRNFLTKPLSVTALKNI